MTEQLEGQGNLFDLDTWCGKTYQEHLVPTKAKTSKPSSKRSSTLSKKHPICLCLMGGGPNRDVSTMNWEVGALLGEYTMRSFGESPKEERDSHLSQILEEEAHQKYFLSEKACRGILNRAKRRGKELPTELKNALIKQSAYKEMESTELTQPDVTAKGGEKIKVTPSIQSTDLQSIVLNDQGGGVMNITNNMTGTIRASEHGHQPIIFEPRSQDGVPRVGDQHISPTLNTGGVDNDNHVSYSKTFTHNAYDTIVESETSSTLKANGENYGGGVGIICDSTVGALQARDCKGVGNQYVNEGKLIIDARQNRNT